MFSTYQPKSSPCTAEAICRVSTPLGSVGTYSQCNVDSDCDKTLYPTSEAGKDASRPPRRFCCSDLVTLYSLHCDNVNPGIINGSVRYFDFYGKTCSQNTSDCISQFVAEPPKTGVTPSTAAVHPKGLP